MTYVDASCAPLRKTGQIKIHGADAFEGMRKAGRLAAECLDMLVGQIKPGVTTEHIDRLIFELGMDHGAMPATLMYRGYRKSTCTSVNHVVCHGIPSEKPLREGDIVNVDVTLILDNWHGDSSRMYAVGEVPRRAERLIEVTYEGMMRGIAAIKPGGTSGDVGHAIQSYVEAQHMSCLLYTSDLADDKLKDLNAKKRQKLDVLAQDNIDALAKTIAGEFGALDILVNLSLIHI